MSIHFRVHILMRISKFHWCYRFHFRHDVGDFVRYRIRTISRPIFWRLAPKRHIKNTLRISERAVVSERIKHLRGYDVEGRESESQSRDVKKRSHLISLQGHQEIFKCDFHFVIFKSTDNSQQTTDFVHIINIFSIFIFLTETQRNAEFVILSLWVVCAFAWDLIDVSMCFYFFQDSLMRLYNCQLQNRAKILYH